MRVALSYLFVALPLIASAPFSIARAAEACDTLHASQADLNECYGSAFKESDAQLNALYRQITGRLRDDKATTKLLVTAQRAWVAFRDAECAFSTSAVSGGSAHGMIQVICLDRLTSKRIDDLKTYLRCPEGDMDCPVPAQ